MGLFDSLEITEELKVDKVTSGEKVSFDKVQKTGVYEFTIQTAYGDVSEVKEFNGAKSGGALNITLEMVGPAGTLKTFEYVTAGVQKGRKPTFVYDKYRKLHYVLTGEEIKNLKTENGLVSVYDFDTGEMADKTKAVLTDWVGKKVKAACCRTLEDKFNSDGEIKDFVVVQSFLDAESGQSYAEKKDNAEAKYINDFGSKRDENFIVDKRETTKDLPIPVIKTKEEKDAEKKEEPTSNAFGGEGISVEDNDEIPF